MMLNYIFAILPLLPSLYPILQIRNQEIFHLLLISFLIAIVTFLLSNSLIPIVAEYTLKSGLCGKDLGKKGSKLESKDIPEALGIVSGTTYLITAIFSQLIFATTTRLQVIYNSALFSICFMIFLGFTDDTLELKWRYKLVLPTVASLPLLSSYSGSTALLVPQKLQTLLMSDGSITTLGSLINLVAVVDTEANGAIVELGSLFLLYMGLLAVFCTNAINIYAGINGLECGQSYVIACSVLFFKLYDASQGAIGEDSQFALVMIIPFISVCLSLLRSNWFPARVFVGDTFCYFSGMTFAVVGIHGHFSKTLLLLFLPQVLNFIYSIPQLFKILPCPRHRLPRIDPKTQLMSYSTFPCTADQYTFFKVQRNSLECPNCTLICLVLRLTGPLSERTLCIVLLALQGTASILTFIVRYYILV